MTTPAIKMMLIGTSPDKDAVSLILESVHFEAKVGPYKEASLAYLTDIAQRIALCVNMHAQQTVAEIMASGEDIYLHGVERGINEAIKQLGGDSAPGSAAMKLAILNQVRIDMAAKS
jgi:hypothetical protein